MCSIAIYINKIIRKELMNISRINDNEDGFIPVKVKNSNKKVIIQLDSKIYDRFVRLNVSDDFNNKIIGTIHWNFDEIKIKNNECLFIFRDFLEVINDKRKYKVEYVNNFMIDAYPYSKNIEVIPDRIIKFQDYRNMHIDRMITDPDILSEINDELIFKLIVNLNRLGYLTFSSQPGTKIKESYPIFEDYREWSASHYTTETKSKINYAKGYHQQKAQVAGFLSKKVAIILFDELKNDPHILVQIGNIVNGEFTKGSCWFDENEKCVSSKNINEKPYIPSSGIRIFNPNEEIVDILDIFHQFGSDEEFIYFSTMETRWNDNSYMWIKLNDTISRITN